MSQAVRFSKAHAFVFVTWPIVSNDIVLAPVLGPRFGRGGRSCTPSRYLRSSCIETASTVGTVKLGSSFSNRIKAALMVASTDMLILAVPSRGIFWRVVVAALVETVIEG